jgi:transposase-like protein
MEATRHYPETLVEAIRYFADPDRALDFMVKLRWPDGVVRCPRCGSDGATFIASRRLWQCHERHERRQFTVKVGTIFEDSPLALDKWLAAIWMLANSKNGISSYELHRSIGVTQKTAWFMLRRIRLAMQDGGTHGGGLSGQIEVDETFIGGKARFMHQDKRAAKIKGTGGMGKVAVMGLLDRHGADGHSTVALKIIPNTRRSTLAAEVRARVEPASVVFTDALKSYDDLADDYIHGVIDHAEKYVEGTVHTNGLENFWSLLKRAVKGTYVSVEPFHHFRYLDEEATRFNTRRVADGERFHRVLRTVVGRRLTYKQLTGKEVPLPT